MKLKDFDFGFVETFENPVVEKVVCKYNGICTVYFYNKPSLELNIGCSAYNYQYGIPISEDGTKLFVGSWEKGLFAYDLLSGELLWRFKPGRIRNIFVYSKSVVVSRANTSIVKIDIETGEMLAIIKSGTLEHIFNLGFPYIFADSMSGKYCIIDVEQMSIVKKYSSRIVNPHDCLSLMVTNVVLQHNAITIFGIEEHPKKTFNPKVLLGGTCFSRIIDHYFDTV